MKSVVSKQEQLIAKQQKQIEALSATVRKVSERVELSVPAPQIAANED
jgi:cell division protein FtsB